jgi:methyltransferase (TIGR00027 family)
MSSADQSIHHISETALLAAVYRADETARPDALFRDPLAARLAGQRGKEILAATPPKERVSWAWVARTVLFDELILEQVRQGADTVVNFAAGLDTRPYRMALPARLRWVEVDLPDLLSDKENLLGDEKPTCALERIALDLADRQGRRELIAKLAQRSSSALAITEGLLVYLSPEQVGELACDLREHASVQSWIIDVVSPGLLQMLQGTIGTRLRESGSAMKFGPAEGPEFFVPFGWKPAVVRTILKAGARYKRVPFWMRLLALLPEAKKPRGKQFWSAVCLLENTQQGKLP